MEYMGKLCKILKSLREGHRKLREKKRKCYMEVTKPNRVMSDTKYRKK